MLVECWLLTDLNIQSPVMDLRVVCSTRPETHHPPSVSTRPPIRFRVRSSDSNGSPDRRDHPDRIDTAEGIGWSGARVPPRPAAERDQKPVELQHRHATRAGHDGVPAVGEPDLEAHRVGGRVRVE